MNTDARATLKSAILSLVTEAGSSAAVSETLRYLADVTPRECRPILRDTDLKIVGDPGATKNGRPLLDDSKALARILADEIRGVAGSVSIHREAVRLAREQGGTTHAHATRLRRKRAKISAQNV